MIEYRVRKIERYEVTRYSDMNSYSGVETVASNLTKREADDIAGAMYERAHSAGMSVKAIYASGQVLGGEREASVFGGTGIKSERGPTCFLGVSNDELLRRAAYHAAEARRLIDQAAKNMRGPAFPNTTVARVIRNVWDADNTTLSECPALT